MSLTTTESTMAPDALSTTSSGKGVLESKQPVLVDSHAELDLSGDSASVAALRGVYERVSRGGERTDRYNGHVVRQLTATETKARILSLLDEVAAGEEIEITKHGRTVARLVPAAGPAALRGRFSGRARSVDDDELLFTTGTGWEFD